MLSWLWASSALAGVRSDLLALAAEQPDLAIACTSARRFARVAVKMGAVGPAASLPPKVAELLRRVAAAESTVADTSFAAALWEAPDPSGKRTPRSAELVFQTTQDLDGLAAQVGELLGSTVDPPSGDHRGLHPASGPPVDVSIDAGRATVRIGPPSDPHGPLDPHLLQQLPDTDGCEVVIRLPPSDGDQLALHFPFEGGEPLRFAVSGMTAAEGVERASPRPLVTTSRTPFGVMVVGERLRSVNPSTLAGNDPKKLRVVRWVQRRLPLDGFSIAMFSDPPAMAADFPLDADWSAVRATRRVRKVATKIASFQPGMQVVPISDTRFEIRTIQPLTVMGIDGGVRIASDPQMLEEMAARTGTPWLVGESAARSDGTDLYLTVDLGRFRILGLPEPTVASVRFAWVDGVGMGELFLPVTLDQLADLGRSATALRPRRPRPAPR